MDIITNANGEIVLLNDGSCIGFSTQQAIQLKDKFSISSEQGLQISNSSQKEFTYSFIDSNSKNKQYVLIPQHLDSSKNYFVYADVYNTDSRYTGCGCKSLKIKYDATLPGYKVIFINGQGEEKVAATVTMFNNSISRCQGNTDTVTYFSDLVSDFPDYTFFIAEVNASSNRVEPAIIDFTDTTQDGINLLLLNKKQIVES